MWNQRRTSTGQYSSNDLPSMYLSGMMSGMESPPPASAEFLRADYHELGASRLFLVEKTGPLTTLEPTYQPTPGGGMPSGTDGAHLPATLKAPGPRRLSGARVAELPALLDGTPGLPAYQPSRWSHYTQAHGRDGSGQGPLYPDTRRRSSASSLALALSSSPSAWNIPSDITTAGTVRHSSGQGPLFPVVQPGAIPPAAPTNPRASTSSFLRIFTNFNTSGPQIPDHSMGYSDKLSTHLSGSDASGQNGRTMRTDASGRGLYTQEKENRSLSSISSSQTCVNSKTDSRPLPATPSQPTSMDGPNHFDIKGQPITTRCLNCQRSITTVFEKRIVSWLLDGCQCAHTPGQLLRIPSTQWYG
ncbi:hypothetical protein H4R33_006167 [Dimargaris cristalligena]|uniref:Uncharacterized protein n=1 Tax=Dimargaris cristalligena TaxID=215637 RepID=A0A4P9ZNQ9_9FUNG|nr:hypothetical protein H4R33_006167 [Dimargaris cristalligena]RKP34788.1 hypothetical protein BJ085DRAFT_37143 [Dimargaris cristalligena]|eukprot:RKP34788.1 hypothetical protein BJ085DRAFT_37143 [Dimargaris cristalligena]